jgi:general stress protein 26
MDAITPDQLNEQDRAKALEFLRQYPVGILATVNPDGGPDACAVYFGVRDNFDVTFTTKRDTQKHHNLSQNNKVKLVVLDAASQSQIQISGEAVEVDDPDTAQQIFQGTVQASQDTGPDSVPPVSKYSGGPYVAYTIKTPSLKIHHYGWGDNFKRAMDHANDPATTGDPA